MRTDTTLDCLRVASGLAVTIVASTHWDVKSPPSLTRPSPQQGRYPEYHGGLHPEGLSHLHPTRAKVWVCMSICVLRVCVCYGCVCVSVCYVCVCVCYVCVLCVCVCVCVCVISPSSSLLPLIPSPSPSCSLLFSLPSVFFPSPPLLLVSSSLLPLSLSSLFFLTPVSCFSPLYSPVSTSTLTGLPDESPRTWLSLQLPTTHPITHTTATSKA